MRTTPLDTQTGVKPEEGNVAKTIEHQTQKIPSDIFLWTALGFFGLAAAMQSTGRKHSSLLLSQLAPTFLLLGIYNKLVKVVGSDAYDRKAPAFGR
jgi:hypothetical protein